MEATAECPAKIPLGRPFTAQNAAQMAVRSAAAKRAKREARAAELQREDAEAKRIAQTTPQSATLARQLDRLSEMMMETNDPDALAKLSVAHGRLFDAWQVLTGTPNPGSRKSKPARGAGHSTFEPIGPATDSPPSVQQ
jgi:hypothetical protein